VLALQQQHGQQMVLTAEQLLLIQQVLQQK
jgi:hypothetical protein